MTIRKTVVAGSFYPNEKEELLKYFKHFSKDLKKQKHFNKIQALIVPHAGYIYSGFTANMAYTLSSDENYKKVVIIGPSHHCNFKGASIALYEAYETPLGDIPMDLEKAKELIEEFSFLGFNEDAHYEHSSETQAPFIKHYFPKASMLEIVYGKLSYLELSLLIEKFLKEEVLVIISTDLSHFHKEEKAKILDDKCIEAIKMQDSKALEGCEACGIVGLKALIKTIQTKKLESKLLHYANSSHVSGDKSRVVGYTSFLIGE